MKKRRVSHTAQFDNEPSEEQITSRHTTSQVRSRNTTLIKSYPVRPLFAEHVITLSTNQRTVGAKSHSATSEQRSDTKSAASIYRKRSNRDRELRRRRRRQVGVFRLCLGWFYSHLLNDILAGLALGYILLHSLISSHCETWVTLLTAGRISFTNRTPLLWNMLPSEVQTSSSMLVFKKNVLSLVDSPASGKNLLQICFGNTTI